MAVASTLRDRRKLQTAADIQRAAVSLALSSGYESLTTEMIAVEAGISLRTFFNYYPNKDAAIVGQRPVIDDENIELFRASSGPLIDDLFLILKPMLNDAILDRELARMIGELLARCPDLFSLFHASLGKLNEQLKTLIIERIGAGHDDDAELLAQTITYSISFGFKNWAEDASLDRDQITVIARQRIRALTSILRNNQTLTD